MGALLATVLVAVQRPACFYLPVKAVLRCAVLLVTALEHNAHMLAARDTPKWQSEVRGTLHVEVVQHARPLRLFGNVQVAGAF